MKNKDIIVGGLGSGKTTLIREKIIPTLNNYVVFDFCDEYRLHIKDFNAVIYFNGFVGSGLKNLVIKHLKSTNDNKTIIIDNAHLLYFPKKNLDRGFDWLNEALKNKSCILVFQNAKQFANKGLVGNYSLTIIENYIITSQINKK